jgi:hypothetical protein
MVLVGGGVDGTLTDEDAFTDEDFAEMSVAKVRKMLTSSRRIENDILAVGGDSNNERTNDSNERASRTSNSRSGPNDV